MDPLNLGFSPVEKRESKINIHLPSIVGHLLRFHLMGSLGESVELYWALLWERRKDLQEPGLRSRAMSAYSSA